MDLVDIYNTIDEGEDLNFDNCYIEDFDLSCLQAASYLNTRAYVNLKGLFRIKFFL